MLSFSKNETDLYLSQQAIDYVLAGSPFKLKKFLLTFFLGIKIAISFFQFI
jgi:hypothetical protein